MAPTKMDSKTSTGLLAGEPQTAGDAHAFGFLGTATPNKYRIKDYANGKTFIRLELDIPVQDETIFNQLGVLLEEHLGYVRQHKLSTPEGRKNRDVIVSICHQKIDEWWGKQELAQGLTRDSNAIRNAKNVIAASFGAQCE